MKTIVLFLILLVFSACSNSKEYKETDYLITEEKPLFKEEEEEAFNLFLQIPKEYQLIQIDSNFVYQLNLNESYCAYNNADFEAAINESKSLIAINNNIKNDVCYEYKSFLLQQNEVGEWKDVFEILYPDLNIYAFYGFEDKQVGQFEGDEKTVFAGFKFHFDKADSIGVQFMFCNLSNAANTKKLNEEGKVIYKAF